MSKPKYALVNKWYLENGDFDIASLGIIRKTENGKFAYLNDSASSNVRLNSLIQIYDLGTNYPTILCVLNLNKVLKDIILSKCKIDSEQKFTIVHYKDMLTQVTISKEDNLELDFEENIAFPLDINPEIEIYEGEEFIGKFDILDLIFEAIGKNEKANSNAAITKEEMIEFEKDIDISSKVNEILKRTNGKWENFTLSDKLILKEFYIEMLKEIDECRPCMELVANMNIEEERSITQRE